MREVSFLEKLAEDLIEGGFAKALKPRLQPVQIAKSLAKEMGASTIVGPDGPLVANSYSVFLHTADFSLFAGFQGNLEGELAGYLRGYAQRRGLKPLGAISVSVKAATDVRPGRIHTSAAMMDTPQPSPEMDSSAQPIGNTMEMAVVSVAAPASAAASPNQPVARLIGSSGEEILLIQRTTTVGRAIDNDIVLEAKSVSRHHAKIHWEAGGYTVEDLGSTNGSFVAGRRINRHFLQDGEQLLFAGVLFTFRLSGV
jgi:hypothetical protein